MTPFIADIDSEANVGDDKLCSTILFQPARRVLVLKGRALFFCPSCGQKIITRGCFFYIKMPRIRSLSVIHEHLLFGIIN